MITLGLQSKNLVIEELRRIVGQKWVVTDQDMLENYLHDETPSAVCPSPAANIVLVKPANTDEVANVLRFANTQRIPVFPVGGRTGLVGGSIPIVPGIMLSLERLNQITIDHENMMVVTGAGVTLYDLNKAAEAANLSFPLHPGDEGSQIGGMVATNAGGARAVRYGVMRNYVKGIEAVLPTGEVLRLGGKLLKNNVGYDLIDLIIGSEGTLAVITKAIIKLYPQTRFGVTLIAPFDERKAAMNAVSKILQSEIVPLAIEYVERTEVEKSASHLNEKWPVNTGEVQIIIILRGNSDDEIYPQCEKIWQICKQYGGVDPLIADTKEKQERILRIRSQIYTSIKPDIYDILDITVPPNNLGDFIDAVKSIAKKYQIRVPIYGHAGDGNLHVHLMKDIDCEGLRKAKLEMYEAGIKLGGVITGEHGIGVTRVDNLVLNLSKKEIELMCAIKKTFDPNNILNPGKVVPSCQ